MIFKDKKAVKMKDDESVNSDLDAIFIGWQETISGDFMALYNITNAYHPYYQSTVTENTLKKMKLRFRQPCYSKNR